MASPRVGVLRTMANMAAFLPEVRGKMAPAFFLLGVPPPPPVLPPLLLLSLRPPCLRHRRLRPARQTPSSSYEIPRLVTIPIHAALPSSPGGDGFQAPVECPAVVPS
ncbi:hypothetical protein HPB50_027804 [Hyalomma asiaticum]|nr:hypothetical protein HPB50_027804 [Hyalomma asiaticum]